MPAIPCRRLLPVAALLAIAAALLPPARAVDPAAPAKKVREPAVAGLFYPQDPAGLSKMLASFLQAAPSAPIGELKALICPHAGYEYSGPVAATAYARLHEGAFDTVVVMAPAHYAAFRGASVCGADLYRTPLGDVPISAKARTLAAQRPYALDARAQVERPGWWRQASRMPPAPREENAHTWEHAGEVQVPFLQQTLKKFELVPVVFGTVDPAEAARGLAAILDDRTLLVVSSDLSHYHPYAEAQALDHRCVDAICQLDVAALAGQEACGLTPILTLVHLAKARGWQAHLLDLRNSGDTAGDKSRVVGYAAIAFTAPPAPTAAYSAEDRRFLLELARRTVREVVDTGRLPAIAAGTLAARFTEPKGCFVTLTEHGRLRGCIGSIVAHEPLYQSVIENARNAAVRDPRFFPVTAAEVAGLEIEISVLTVPQVLEFASPQDLLAKLQPHRDGVVLQIGGRGATYLPQVWEQIPDKVEFLSSLAQKAGCERDDWRRPGTRVQIYHVESFAEGKL